MLVTQLVITLATSLRTCESMLIAPASFRLIVRPRADGSVYREMRFLSCIAKRTGPGQYENKLFSGKGLESNGIALVLLYMERVGMLENATALEVYEGTKPMLVDSAKWESAEYLEKKITEAIKIGKESLLEALSKQAEEDWNEEEEEKLESRIIRLLQSIRMPEDPRPMYGTFTSKYYVPERYDPDSGQLMKQLGKSVGYLPTNKKFFSITGARRGHQQDNMGIGAQIYNGNTQEFQNLIMRHNSTIALQYYHDANAMNARLPSNLLQSSVDEATVRAALELNANVPPAYDKEFFFKKYWAKQTQELPSPVDFLREQAIPSQTYKCFAVNCDVTFAFPYELMDHMNARHSGKGKFQCICPDAKVKNVPFNRFKSTHINKCEHSGLNNIGGVTNNKGSRYGISSNQPPKALVVYHCGRG